ncbi:MAG: C40 family peptidase [Bacteroidetes bacterium]|nr:C40 family peptidase [Bacteroidota bacterium]MBS1756539.1 C40 family peptidase [Bacteroidota bacterium]
MQYKYAICKLPIAQVRLLPDHRDELTSQYLFGEQGTIMEEQNGWILLQQHFDGYIGWCRSNQFFITTELPEEKNIYTGEWVNSIMINNQKMMVPYGSNLSLANASYNGMDVKYEGVVIDAANATIDEENIKRISSLFLNTTYLWGGKSVFGIDCSGYVQTVFKMLNIALLRDAKLQVGQGEAIGFLQEARCGDLAFFDEADEIMHVGILLNDHEIIHSSGNVRIDKIDAQGIINTDTGRRTHRLRVIKRVIV